MAADSGKGGRSSLQAPVDDDEATALEVLITLSGCPTKANQAAPSTSEGYQDGGTPSPRRQPRKAKLLEPLFPGVRIPKKKASPLCFLLLAEKMDDLGSAL